MLLLGFQKLIFITNCKLLIVGNEKRRFEYEAPFFVIRVYSYFVRTILFDVITAPVFTFTM